VLLKRIFSGQPDNVLRPIREVISSSANGFPYSEIFDKLKRTPKSLSFDEDEISNFFYYQYGQAYTYSILAFIYPSLDFRNKFHQDHIFPKSLFTAKRLQKYGIPEADIQFYLENYNCIANLQLLEGIPNQEKSGKEFSKWILEKYPNENDRKQYMERHYIPDCSLEMTNFREFIEKRKKLIANAFKNLIK
ncbi:MAG TPA: hypothetical protein PLO40_09770, partial [Spirochaetota bacterium]|nr:hypothetical protein [Spirochaetota bacterium]